MELHVTGVITAKEEYKDIVKNAILKLIQVTRKEKASILYNAHQSEDDPNIFTFHEIWEDEEGFNFHMEQSYIADFIELLNDKLVTPLLVVKGQIL